MTVATHDSVERYAAPPAVGRLQTIALAVGLVAAAACVVGWVVDADQFFFSWLLGCISWLGLSLGALALTMIHSLTGGAWGLPARRVLEAAAGVLPLLFVLCLPLLAGIEALYPWAGPAMDDNAMLAHKQPYLNAPFFVGRFFVYFAVWIGLAWWLRRLSLRQDRTGDPMILKTMAKVGAPGLVVWAFLVTFAYFDWLMSLEPLWFSTIYGVYFFGGAGISALAFLVLATVWLARAEPMRSALAPRHLHDWGKLLFAFIMLWGYFSFSQFLITWSGNLPEEIEWYLHRTGHGWRLVTVLLVLFHFAVPFVLLLSRDLKKHARRLAWMAASLLFMRWVDYLWQIAPSHHHELAVHWLDVAAPVAVGGLWLAAFAWLLRRHPILPPRDPYLLESIGEETRHGH